MVAEELHQQLTQLGQQYWEGKENFLIRYWTYLNKGLDVFNNFKYYLGLPIVAGAVFPFVKDNPVLLAGVLIAGLPILVLAGRYQMHKVNKTTEYVNAITGSIFQFKPMELNIEMVNLLKSIDENLKKLNESH